MLGLRAGGAFDPEIAALLAGDAEEILTLDDGVSTWDQAHGGRAGARR